MKQKLKISVVLGSIALLLIGCTEPEFNPSNKGLVFYQGKPYAVPYGSYHEYTDLSKASFRDGFMKASLKEGNKNLYQMVDATTCRLGEVSWESQGAREEILYALKNQPDDTGKLFMHLTYKAKLENKIGCARPLTQQEYQYYLAKGSDTTQGSMDSINNSLQNTRNSIQQNTYNTQQATNQIQQSNDQMYQQKQDKKTNYQLQQINNNLNGIRYGY